MSHPVEFTTNTRITVQVTLANSLIHHGISQLLKCQAGGNTLMKAPHAVAVGQAFAHHQIQQLQATHLEGEAVPERYEWNSKQYYNIPPLLLQSPDLPPVVHLLQNEHDPHDDKQQKSTHLSNVYTWPKCASGSALQMQWAIWPKWSEQKRSSVSQLDSIVP